MQKIDNKKIAGFTLIELIIVIAVLLFVVGTAMGIFISIVQQQKRILAEQELLNQASYVLEHMSKALRMAKKDFTGECLKDDVGNPYYGYNYILTRPVGGVYTGIKFINQSDNDACQEFFLYNEDPDNPVLKEIKNDGQEVAITSDKLFINSIRFGINGSDGLFGGAIGSSEDDGVQPRVTIFLDIQNKTDKDRLPEKIQTTVSQRDLNIK